MVARERERDNNIVVAMRLDLDDHRRSSGGSFFAVTDCHTVAYLCLWGGIGLHKKRKCSHFTEGS